jgi:hypothetical protein
MLVYVYVHLVYFAANWYIFYGDLVHFMAIWYILWRFGTFYGDLVHFMAIWYILWRFGILFPILVGFTKKNLATLTSIPSVSALLGKNSESG